MWKISLSPAAEIKSTMTHFIQNIIFHLLHIREKNNEEKWLDFYTFQKRILLEKWKENNITHNINNKLSRYFQYIMKF